MIQNNQVSNFKSPPFGLYYCWATELHDNFFEWHLFSSMYSLSQVLLVTATKQELASTDISRIAEEKVDLLGYWKRKFTMRNKYPCNFNQIIKKKKRKCLPQHLKNLQMKPNLTFFKQLIKNWNKLRQKKNIKWNWSRSFIKHEHSNLYWIAQKKSTRCKEQYCICLGNILLNKHSSNPFSVIPWSFSLNSLSWRGTKTNTN